MTDILIVGGGCIGLGIAAELGQDHSVTLIEKNKCGRGASYAAAGMIAPIMEVEFNEPEILKLGQKSHALYPEYVKELSTETNEEVGFRDEGTLAVALNQPQIADLERLHEYQTKLGLDVDKLSVSDCREIEPRISNYVSKAIFCKSEYQVDNRELVRLQKMLCQKRNVEIHEHEPLRAVRYENNRIKTVQSKSSEFNPDTVILAAGVETSRLPGLRESDQLPIRPVKGQALSVKLSEPPEISHVIRSPDVYCVPKDDGRLVIGSTMEEKGFNRTVTAGAILDLLHDAYEVLPFIYENEFLESWSGLRPASRDSLPVLGPSQYTENLIFATGHYRNGILLTPITVKLLSEYVRNRSIPAPMTEFLPGRFQED